MKEDIATRREREKERKRERERKMGKREMGKIADELRRQEKEVDNNERRRK
jgi:hypothetical protein